MAIATPLARKPVELDELVEKFESAWRSHGSAQLSEFLPEPEDPGYMSVLCELVRVDLDLHWSNGHPINLDTYIREFTILSERRDLLSQIAYEEYRQRFLAGHLVTPEEYQMRYHVDVTEWPAPTKLKNPIDREHDAYPQTRVLDEGNLSPEVVSRRDARTVRAPIKLIRTSAPGFPRIGDVWEGFKLVSRLGSGSFGLVFLAHETSLADRPVALKISIHQSSEPEKLARLQHTNIVPVHSVRRVGRLQGVCMPYFGPATLAHLIDAARDLGRPPATGAEFLQPLLERTPAGRTDARTALYKLAHTTYVDAVLRIIVQITDGLIYAHEKGMLHRDLKPANILLTDDGRPMLLDFNLAADLRPDGTPIRAGGTIPYMAPEQLEGMRGRPMPIDARSDLYSIGIILYELLTGELPYSQPLGRATAVVSRMLNDRRSSPPDPRLINRAVPPAVVAVLQKLLATDPARRYASAEQLKEDLERHLGHLPLKYAPNPSLVELVRKFHRRNPKLARQAAAVLTLAAAVVLPLSAFAYYQQKNYQRSAQIVHAESVTLMRDARGKARTAVALLHSRHNSSAARQQGQDLVEQIVATYRIDRDGRWLAGPAVAGLSDLERRDLLTQLGDAFLVRAEAERQSAADRHDPSGKELALKWNRLAETCFVKLGTVPDRLRSQRDDIENERPKPATKKVRTDDELAAMDTADLYAAASDLFSAGETRQALRHLNVLTAREPSHFMAWHLKGLSQESLGDTPGAAASFTVCIALNPEFPWPYASRAAMYLRIGKAAEALVDLNQAVKLEPKNATTLMNRAWSKLAVKDYAGADEDLTKVLADDASEVRALLMRHDARRRAGKEKEANADLAAALSAVPRTDAAWCARAYYQMDRDPKRALADYDEALKLNPRNQTALRNKTYVLSEKLRDNDAALAVAEQMIEFYPDTVHGRACRAVIMARKGQLDEAFKDVDYCLVCDGSACGLYHMASLFAVATKFDSKYKDRALTLLADALRKGYPRPKDFETDPDLDPLRKDPEFERLCRVAKELQQKDKATGGR